MTRPAPAARPPFRPRPCGQRHARQRGVAVVEFAIVVFVLLLLFAGVVEFGRAFMYYDALSKGTRNAARYLATTSVANLSATGTSADLRALVRVAADGVGMPNFTDTNVSFSCSPKDCSTVKTSADIQYVTVSATYSFTVGSLVPFIAANSTTRNAVTLTPYTTMRYTN